MIPYLYRLTACDAREEFGDQWGWVVRGSGLTLWDLKRLLRAMRRRGYPDDQILVERDLPWPKDEGGSD